MRFSPTYSWDSVADELGVTSDGVIAKRLGCSRSAVRLARQRLGIMPATSPPDRLDWTTVDPLLGTMSDVAASAATGFGVHEIGARRKALGIARFSRAKARQTR